MTRIGLVLVAAVSVGCGTNRAESAAPVASRPAPIEPAVEEVRGEPGDLVANAVEAHVIMAAQELEASCPTLAARVDADAVRAMAISSSAVFGMIEFLPSRARHSSARAQAVTRPP